MKRSLRYFLLAGVVLSSGCGSLRTPWNAPEANLPANWETVTGAAIPGQEIWWKNFGDPQLNGLVDQVLRTNNDFAAAVIRVGRARLQAGLVDTSRTPSVAVGGNTTVTRTTDPESTSHSSGVRASLSFELDLWGKLASQRDAAHWEAKATEADCRAFALSLVGTTTRLYWQVAYLNQLLALAAADIEYAERTLALARVRYEAGAVSALNVAQAELSLSSQRAYRTQLVQQRVEARHALAILSNQPPETDVAVPRRLSDTPLPAVAAGLPAGVLANRPDLYAAELRLRESLANVDFTRSFFYPTLTLTGSLGTASTALRDLLQNPVATLGAGLVLPFVQWNTTQLSIRVSETQYEEAVVGYRQRLYTALAEVEDGLSSRTQLMAEGDALRAAVAQARRAESISRTRYEAGFTEIQLWLDAQASLRSTQRSLIANRLNQLNSQVNLYKALGLGAGAERIRCG